MFQMLFQKRFGPFFGVQFLGTLNDNLFKNTFVVLIAFRAASEAESGVLTNLAAGLFILPYFLFSAAAGQLSDKFEKPRIMRIIKAAEIGIMALGAIGFYFENTLLLFVTLFLMGSHSAFFGPAKYSILPHFLKENEIMAGNALVEMGTFMAILLGTLGGGLLAAQNNVSVISTVILCVALLGFLVSLKIPSTAATAPNLKLNWNLFQETWELTNIVRKKPALFNSILGISWFWYFGATILAQLPNYTKHILYGDETVVTLLLGIFSVSIGLGSLLCAKLSRGDIELGLVPIGAFGLSIFTAHLAFIEYPLPSGVLMGVSEMLSGPHSAMGIRVILDMTFIGVSASLFIVPLYALIQTRSEPESRSRVIAANNVFNAVFMVASALITMVMFKIGFNTVEIFLFIAILNLVVNTYIFLLIPEFVMRFVIWVLASTIYRLRYTGRDNVPHFGPAVIVCNHVSFIDWFIIIAASRRPVRFVMDHRIFNTPVLGMLFKLSKAIPIAPAKEDAAAKEKAFDLISQALKDGHLVCIFPEGKITFDGALDKFRPGIDRILRTDPVPVIPMAIQGLWGSFFSRKGGAAMAAMPKPSRRVISVAIGEVMPPTTSYKELESKVQSLIGQGGLV